MTILPLFQCNSESLREGRLIYQRPAVRGPEREPSLLDRLADEHADLAQLEQSIASPNSLSMVSQAMYERGPLLAEERAAIDRNLNRLRARTKTKPEIHRRIEEIQRSIAPSRRPQARPAEQPLPVPPPAEKPWYERSWERTKGAAKATKDWCLDFSTPGKIALRSALGLGAAYGVYRLFRWMFGKKKAEGAEQKGEKKGGGWWKTLLWIPGLGLLGYGVYWLYKNWPSETIQQAGRALEDAREGAAQGVGVTARNVERAFGADVREIREIRRRLNSEECRNNPELARDLSLRLLQKGGKIILVDGFCYLFYQGQQVYVGGWEVAKLLWNRPEGVCDQLIKVYVGTAIVYATSWSAVDFAWLLSDLGIKGAAKESLRRAAFWPYEIWRKGLRQATGFWMPTAHGEIVRTELKLSFSKGGYALNRLRYSRLIPGTWQEAHLEQLFEEWHMYDQMMSRLKTLKGGDMAKTALQNRMNWIERQMLRGMRKLGRVPEFLGAVGGEEGAALARQFASAGGDVNIDTFRTVLRRSAVGAAHETVEAVEVVEEGAVAARNVAGASEAAEAARTTLPHGTPPEAPGARPRGQPSPLPEAGKKTKPSPIPADQPAAPSAPKTTATEAPPKKLTPVDRGVKPGKIGGEGASLMEGQPEGMQQAARRAAAGAAAEGAAVEGAMTPPHIDQLLKHKDIQKALARATSGSAEAERLLRRELAALDAETAQMILESRKARRLMAGAAATGKAPEMSRILEAARRAKNIRLGGAIFMNGVGVVGDLFAIGMMFYDLDKNKERILETENQELKEIYSKANYLYYGEGGAGLAGLVVGGVAMFKVYAATHSIVIALGAPAGLVMLPIAAAALSARVTYQKLEESSEYHTLTERDLIKKYSQGQILEHIGKSTHLTNVNWAQDFFLSDEMAHKANETARNMGYRAYCAQIAAERVPPASVLDIDPDTLADLQQRGVQDARRPDGKTNLEALLENEQRNRISAFVGAAERYIAYRTQNTFDLVTPDVLRNATLYAEIQFEKFDKTSLPEFKPWNDTSYWAEAERWIAERSAVVTQAMTQGLCTLSARPAEFERDAPSRLLGMIRDEMAMCERRILVADYPNWELPNWWPSQWYGEASMQMIARGVVSEELWKELRRVTSGVREGRAITPADVSVSVQHLRDILLQDPIQCAQKGIQSSEAGYYRHAGEFPARLSVSGMLDLVNSYRLSPPTSPGVSPSTALPLTNVEFYAREGLPFILELQPGQKNGFFLVAESYMMKPSKPGYEPREIGPGVSYTGQLTLQAGEYQFWRKGHSTSKKADFMLLLREKRA